MSTYHADAQASIKMTPGIDGSGQQFTKAQLFYNGSATNEIIITKIRFISSFYYTTYYDVLGKNIGVIKTYSQNNESYFKSFTPTFSGDPLDPNNPSMNSYIGNWARCVGKVASQMTDGSVLGGVAFLGCMTWGAPCAVAIGVGCGISAIANKF